MSAGAIFSSGPGYAAGAFGVLFDHDRDWSTSRDRPGRISMPNSSDIETFLADYRPEVTEALVLAARRLLFDTLPGSMKRSMHRQGLLAMVAAQDTRVWYARSF